MSATCPMCGAPLQNNTCTYCGYSEAPQGGDASAQGAQPQIVINNVNQNQNVVNNGYMRAVSPKSKTVTLLLCLFLGFLGIHRFYVGKIGTGIIWLLTFGLCGVGWLVDFIMILLGAFKDNLGLPIKS